MRRKAVGILALFCIITTGIVCPGISPAEERVVRVGYYSGLGFQEGMTDGAVKSGYAYDYMQKIADETGWKYEYVYGDSTALYDMLVNDEIDILAGLAYTSARGNEVLFPERRMGRENYTLYIETERYGEFDMSDDVSIGTLKSGARTGVLRSWLDERNSNAQVVEFRDIAGMNMALHSGWVDAVVEADNDLIIDQEMVPIEGIGDADYYMCVAPGREDLLNELNRAHQSIITEQPDFLNKLNAQYFSRSASHTVLTAQEHAHIAEHPVLTVGYVDHQEPYCFTDTAGNVSGMLPDAMDQMIISLGLQNQVGIEYKVYDTGDDMIRALRENEIDTAFPVSQSTWHAEKLGLRESDTVSFLSMTIVFANEYTDETAKKIAIDISSPLQRTYVEMYYPEAELILCENMDDCLTAVKNGNAGSTIITGYEERVYLSRQGYRFLHSASLENPARISLAVKKDNTATIRILNRGITMLDEGRIQSMLLGYTEEMFSYDLWDYVQRHMEVLLLSAGIIAALVLMATLAYIHTLEKKNRELAAANEARSAAEKGLIKMLAALSRDELTGLLSREGFYQSLKKEIESNPANNYDLWIGDIYNFKLVNGIYGISRGDELLRYVADFLKTREPDALIGRLGSDRFGVLIVSRSSSVKDAAQYAKMIEQDGPVPSAAVQFGIYRNVDRSLTPQMMCDRAMTALRSVKRSSASGAADYDDPESRRQMRADRMEAEFAVALADEAFVVWYQPKFDLRTGSMTSAEALVRWKLSDGTMISPGEFIPLFERDGLISRLDEYVFRRVCSDMHKWIQIGIDPVPVSVNLSRSSLHSGNIADAYREIADVYGIPMNLLALELTESAATSGPNVQTLTHAIREKGFSLHMDDFGAGYSSLAALNELPFDTIKLDRSLVTMIGESGSEETLRHIVDLSHFKGMYVVAEGVETEEQVMSLKKLGCDEAQGYYYSRPMPGDMFSAAMADRKENVVEQAQENQYSEPAKVNQTGLLRYMTALGSIYTALFVVDTVHDTMLEYSAPAYVYDIISQDRNASAQIRKLILSSVIPEHLADALQFCDITTVSERMRGIRHITQDFIAKEYGWFRIQFIAVSIDEQLRPTELIFSIRVVEKEKRRENDLILASMTDELTGLGNRRAFEADLQKYAASDGGHLPQDLALVSMDVNDLKKINDTLGHAAGDELLRGAAHCMNVTWGRVGSVYRIGGDEFQAIVRAEFVEKTMAQFISATGKWYGTQVSRVCVACGYACVSEIDSSDPEQLIILADRRMYENKTQIKDILSDKEI